MPSFTFYLHFAACAFLAGLIWTVQLILYPAFAYSDPRQFASLHAMHSSKITAVVGPAMTLELVTAIALFFQEMSHWIWSLNLASIVLIWLWTAFVSMPIHQGLSQGFELDRINRLVRTNWLRTIVWTLRLVMLGLLLRGGTVAH